MMMLDTAYKSGQGTAMLSRRGISTIEHHMCFSKNRKNAPKPGEPPKNVPKPNPERMTRNMTRDDFQKLQIADTKPLDSQESEDEMINEVAAKAAGLSAEDLGPDFQANMQHMSKEQIKNKVLQLQFEEISRKALEDKLKHKQPLSEYEMSHFFRSLPFQPYAYTLYPDGAAVGLYAPSHQQVKPATVHVTKDRFTDTRDEGVLTEPLPRRTQYPACTRTQDGRYCSLKARRNKRGNKTLLTGSQIKRLGLKASFDSGGAAGATLATTEGGEKATADGTKQNADGSAEPSGRRSSGDRPKDGAKESRSPEMRADGSLPGRTSKSGLEQAYGATRPQTAYLRHQARNGTQDNKYDFQSSQFRRVRKFNEQISKELPRDVFNGIHPGLPLRGSGGQEIRFDVLAEDLMPSECTSNPAVQSDYIWGLGSAKKTLKEFEKEIYYSNGDYEKAASQVFHKRFLTGQHEFEKQFKRDGFGPGHYIRDQAGFRDSSHLSAPQEGLMYQNLKKLGHVESKRLVGWDLQKPRDNRMYYIGEGGTNLKKMDRHIKRKQGHTINLFSTNVINDDTLKKARKSRVRVGKDPDLSQQSEKRGSCLLAGVSQSTGAQTAENPVSRTDLLFDFYRSGPLQLSGCFSSSEQPAHGSAKRSRKMDGFQLSSSAKEFGGAGQADLSNVSSEVKKFRKLGIFNNVSMRNPPSSAARRHRNMSLGGGKQQPPTTKAQRSSKLNKTTSSFRKNAALNGPE